MTVTMTMDEYLILKAKAEGYQDIKKKLDESNIQKVEWMRAYAILEDYAITKHGLSTKDFSEYLERGKGNGLF